MDNQLTHLVCVADGSGSGSPFTYFTTAESGTVTITFVKATVADHGTSTGWTKALVPSRGTSS